MAEKLLWSISTTVRNPQRLTSFLRVLKKLEGIDFNQDAQIKYQILLIKERLYSPKNIPTEYQKLFDDAAKEIPYEVAKAVFDAQNYESPAIRGRQSVNPLNKLGFSIAKTFSWLIRIIKLYNTPVNCDGHIRFLVTEKRLGN